jgi:hypothetical protein
MRVKAAKVAWIWLIIPAINIPLGIGIFMIVRAQIHSIREAAAVRQDELIARAEQLERERAEAEARANAERDSSQPDEPNTPTTWRPPSGNSNTPNSQNPDEEPPSDTEPDELILTATCNGISCDGLSVPVESVTVRVSSDTELVAPVGWTLLDENTIRRRFSPPDDESEIKPLEVIIRSSDGRSKQVVFRLDLWFGSPPSE